MINTLVGKSSLQTSLNGLHNFQFPLTQPYDESINNNFKYLYELLMQNRKDIEFLDLLKIVDYVTADNVISIDAKFNDLSPGQAIGVEVDSLMFENVNYRRGDYILKKENGMSQHIAGPISTIFIPLVNSQNASITLSCIVGSQVSTEEFNTLKISFSENNTFYELGLTESNTYIPKYTTQTQTPGSSSLKAIDVKTENNLFYYRNSGEGETAYKMLPPMSHYIYEGNAIASDYTSSYCSHFTVTPDTAKAFNQTFGARSDGQGDFLLPVVKTYVVVDNDVYEIYDIVTVTLEEATFKITLKSTFADAFTSNNKFKWTKIYIEVK